MLNFCSLKIHLELYLLLSCFEGNQLYKSLGELVELLTFLKFLLKLCITPYPMST